MGSAAHLRCKFRKKMMAVTMKAATMKAVMMKAVKKAQLLKKLKAKMTQL